jgi:hypothetical protein
MPEHGKTLYTCDGKGGTYELLGHCIGAGTDRGHNTQVYRNAATGQLHSRLPDDFDNRMLPIGELTEHRDRHAAPEWHHLDDVLAILKRMEAGDWAWMNNPRCKYLTLRLDMRDGGCLIRDRYGNRIDPTELAKQ